MKAAMIRNPTQGRQEARQETTKVQANQPLERVSEDRRPRISCSSLLKQATHVDLNPLKRREEPVARGRPSRNKPL